MDFTAYSFGVAAAILGIVIAVVANDHRDLAHWLGCAAVCSLVIGAFCLWQDREWKRDAVPRFTEKPSNITVLAGGTTIEISGDISQPHSGINLGGGHPFEARLTKEGELFVDANVYAGHGRSPIKLRDNRLEGRPIDWDKNSDDSALEIVNERGDPVFQLEYLGSSSAAIKGVFVATGGIVVCDDTPLMQVRGGSAATGPIRYSLRRLFKYPSKRFLGKREPPVKSVKTEIDDSFTKPTLVEIQQQLTESLKTRRVSEMPELIGMKVKWPLVFSGKLEKDGQTVLSFFSESEHRFGFADVVLTPLIERDMSSLFDNTPCIVEGAIEKADVRGVRLGTTSIYPIEVPNQRIIP